MRVLIRTFGCKTNYADSVEVARKLGSVGIVSEMVSGSAGIRDPAGCQGLSDVSNDSIRGNGTVFIVNSCIVTNSAEAEVRRYLNRIRRECPTAKIVLTGCGARAKRIAEKFKHPAVSVVGEIGEVPEKVLELFRVTPGSIPVVQGGTVSAPVTAPGVDSYTYRGFRSRYFLKVQDGCNTGCSFCIIPQTRRLASKSFVDIAREVEEALSIGSPEIVVTGVNVGLYEEPKEGFPLSVLMEKLLSILRGTSRLRLSSVEPEHVDSRMLSVFENERMCPHLHLPLQSGSDRVLADMRRRYSAKRYLEIVDEFRKRFPHGAVTADLMVGYPAEEREDFEMTLNVVKRCGFERAHIFPYSERPGTLSAHRPPFNGNEIKLREKELFEVTRDVARESLARFIGRRTEVAVEALEGCGDDASIGSTREEGKPGNGSFIHFGYGEAYQRVRFYVAGGVVSRLRPLTPVVLERLEGVEFLGKALLTARDEVHHKTRMYER